MSGGRHYRSLLDEYGVRFVQEICKTPFLTRQEEICYCRQAKKGDSEARKMMMLSNARRVMQLAHYFSRKCSRLDLFLELIVDGLVGAQYCY